MKRMDGSLLKLYSRILLAAATLLAALFWLNNLWSACRYHAALLRGEVSGVLPAGFWKLLTWSAVDVSTVTTLIPFFGFLLMWRGTLHVRQDEEWPFFAGYDRLNIALGLLGTLWGIILIGYYPAESVTIPALMSCLHTAMFSTLAAILWVMVLEPLVFRPWMEMLREAEAGSLPEADELDEWLSKITQQLQNSGSALEETGHSAENLCRELAALHEELAREREAGAGFRRELAECCTSLAAVAADFKADRERLTAEVDELSSRNRELVEVRDELTRRNGELTSANATLSAAKESLERRGEELTRRNDELNSANATLVLKRDDLARANETLETRCNLSAQELAAAREQLTLVKNQLEAVRSALR